MSKTITIDELIPLLKRGWVCMDKTGLWAWYGRKPKLTRTLRWESLYWDCDGEGAFLRGFNIAPYQGDWEESLRRVK